MSGCPIPHVSKAANESSCPVDHAAINPNNMMPSLSQDKQENQTMSLGTEREVSTIRKAANTDERWEYPSAQQFFNALKRKGKEAPEENIQMMVDIHNFLNEGSWQEILKWEQKYHCDCDDIGLLKFQGKPDELSPKAWFYTAFRGHDWTVDRCGTPQRYIIDYYGGVDQDNASSFNVDVRPAMDTFQGVKDRLRQAWDELWE